MSTSPAFLKGFFGAPDDDPLLQPSSTTQSAGGPSGGSASSRSRREPESTTTSRSSTPSGSPPESAPEHAEPTLMNPNPGSASEPETVRMRPSSLFDRIKDVVEKTSDAGSRGDRSHADGPRGDGATAPSTSGSPSGYRVRPHYVSPRTAATDANDPSETASRPAAAESTPDSGGRATRIMQVRAGEHEPRDLSRVNDALKDGWCVETVRSASTGDTLVDVVLRRRRPPSLFDFGGTDR